MRRHLAKVSPMMGFLALPTCTGPVGLVDVCSTLTLMPVFGDFPKSSFLELISSRTSFTTASLSAVKFR